MMPLATHSFSVVSNQMLSTFDHEKSRIANSGPRVQASSKDVEHFHGAVAVHGDYGTKF
jgi:hypothetical protein